MKTTDPTHEKPTATHTETTAEANLAGVSDSVQTPPQAVPSTGLSFLPRMPPLTLAPLPIKRFPQLPKDLFYCRSNKLYYLKMPSGNWVELSYNRITRHLVQTYGLCYKTEVEPVIYQIERYRNVDFAGELAGYSEGFLQQGKVRLLVTSGPDMIAPEPGNWSMLGSILKNLLGEEQLTYFYGWLKVALQMFDQKTWMAGQALVLCGPPQSGKNLLTYLVQKLFGGREPGKPYDYMTQKTTFNADLVGSELLTIEDEVSHTDIKARRAFGARIKDLAVNKSRRLHKKYADGLTVVPLQRLIISLNDEAERVMILPPMEHDIADKIMIFKVVRHEMPMPTDTPEAEKAFGNALVAQLPAFAHFLSQWEIPSDLKANRFGVTQYHHPDILMMLNAQTPETKLLSLIDEVVFTLQSVPWHGKANDLERLLISTADDGVQREARKLLSSANACGRYLARIAAKNGNRVIQHPGHAGIHNWTIYPPQLATANPQAEGGAQEHLMQKLRQMAGSTQSVEATVEAGEQDMAA